MSKPSLRTESLLALPLFLRKTALLLFSVAMLLAGGTYNPFIYWKF